MHYLVILLALTGDCERCKNNNLFIPSEQQARETMAMFCREGKNFPKGWELSINSKLPGASQPNGNPLNEKELADYLESGKPCEISIHGRVVCSDYPPPKLPVIAKPTANTNQPAKPAKVGLVRKVGRAVFGKRCK